VRQLAEVLEITSIVADALLFPRHPADILRHPSTFRGIRVLGNPQWESSSIWA
jgi:hypothetical protein